MLRLCKTKSSAKACMRSNGCAGSSDFQPLSLHCFVPRELPSLHDGRMGHGSRPTILCRTTSGPIALPVFSQI